MELIPLILELVDKKALALATAVEVSFLDHEVQQMLYEYMCENEICKTFQIFALRDYLKDSLQMEFLLKMRVLKGWKATEGKDCLLRLLLRLEI